MKHFINLFLFIILTGFLTRGTAQVVTSDPAAPIDSDAITITFYADQGTGGLADYTGDVYAHTGVITNNSNDGTDWKYVKAGWNENISECKLSKVSANQYTLEISPSIREFYGVPDGEIIEQVAFVFRNEDGSKEGKDDGGANIFVDVFEEGLNVKITDPSTRWKLINPGSNLTINGAATEVADLSLTIEDTLTLASVSDMEISSDYTFSQYGNYTVFLHATNTTETAIDSVEVVVMEPATTEEKPANMLDGINYDSNKVSFCIYAPYKSSIILLGDFNNWTPSGEYQLKKWYDRWWITIELEDITKEYAFQYLIDGELLITDPYVNKVLDPWNDKYIPKTVYPNLLSYPNNKTEGIVGVISPGKETFNWESDTVIMPEKENLVIYELHIRDFVESHSIKEVQQKLDYLKELGVNAIELMPFNEFEGNSSWGYNPSYYFATDKYYGTDFDYKTFIKECHSRGIVVIMDMVLNHAFGQNPMVQMYFDPEAGEYGQPTVFSPWFNETSPNTSYYWGFDFDHESVHTQAFVDSVLAFWTNEFHIDGFRLDFTKGFTNTVGDGWAYDAPRIDILKRIYDELRVENPSSLLILEHLTDNAEEKVLSDYGFMLWGNINYNYNEATMGWLAKSDFSWQSYQNRGWDDPYLIAYMESHDEERLMYKNITYGNSLGEYDIQQQYIALTRNMMATVFYFSIPGPKMIWQFGELGYDVSIDYNGRTGEKPIKWELLDSWKNQKLYNTYSVMAKLKKDYTVFSTADFDMQVGNNVADKKLILKGDSADVFVVGNFDVKEITTSAEFTKTGTWYEVFTESTTEVSDVNMELTLQPGEYRLYTTQKFEYTLGLNNESTPEKSSFRVYPNPANEYIMLENLENELIQKWSLVTSNGKFTMQSNQHSSIKKNTFINLSQLQPGIYFLQIQTATTRHVIPVIKT